MARGQRPKQQGASRSSLARGTSVLFYLYGTIATIIGVMVLSAAFLSQSFSSATGLLPVNVSTLPGPLAVMGSFGSLKLGIISVVIIVLSAVDILAGNWISQSKRAGGVTGIFIGVIGLVGTFPFTSASLFGTLAWIPVLANLLLILLVAASWRRLK
jgi:hypothetical protein